MSTTQRTFETGRRQGLQVAAQIMLEVHATVSASGWESEADRLQAFQALLAIAAEECRAVRAEDYKGERDDDGRLKIMKKPTQPIKFYTLQEMLQGEYGDAVDYPKPAAQSKPKPLQPATWEELCELEPRLANLLRMAESIRDLGGRYYCSAESWYMVFKPALMPLVGWERGTGDARLRTSEAWDLCCRKLQRALPDCRDCNCF